MTPADLCRLASATFPGLTFTTVDFAKHLAMAQAPEMRISFSDLDDTFAVVLRGGRMAYESARFATIEQAHADALVVQAEWETHDAAKAATIATQGALDL